MGWVRHPLSLLSWMVGNIYRWRVLPRVGEPLQTLPRNPLGIPTGWGTQSGMWYHIKPYLRSWLVSPPVRNACSESSVTDKNVCMSLAQLEAGLAERVLLHTLYSLTYRWMGNGDIGYLRSHVQKGSHHCRLFSSLRTWFHRPRTLVTRFRTAQGPGCRTPPN